MVAPSSPIPRQPPIIRRDERPPLFRPPDLEGILPDVLDLALELRAPVQKGLPPFAARPNRMIRPPLPRIEQCRPCRLLKMLDHLFSLVTMSPDQDVNMVG